MDLRIIELKPPIVSLSKPAIEPKRSRIKTISVIMIASFSSIVKISGEAGHPTCDKSDAQQRLFVLVENSVD